MNELNEKIQNNNQKISQMKFQSLTTTTSPQIYKSPANSPPNSKSYPGMNTGSPHYSGSGANTGLFRKYYEQQQLLKLEREVLEKKAQQELQAKQLNDIQLSSSNDLYYVPSIDGEDPGASTKVIKLNNQQNSQNYLSQVQPYATLSNDNAQDSGNSLYPTLETPTEDKKTQQNTVLEQALGSAQKYDAEEDLKGKTILEMGKDLLNQVRQYFQNDEDNI